MKSKRPEASLTLRLKLGKVRAPPRPEEPWPRRSGAEDHTERRQRGRQVCRRLPPAVPRDDGLTRDDGPAPEGATGGRAQVGRPAPLLKAFRSSAIAPSTCPRLVVEVRLTTVIALGLRGIQDAATVPRKTVTIWPRRETRS